MYEELMYRLENAARGTEGRKVARDAIDAIAALQAENAEKDKEIKRLQSELLEAREDYMASEMEREQGVDTRSRAEAERDAAVEFIKWIDNEFGNYMPVLYHNRYVEWRGAQGEG